LLFFGSIVLHELGHAVVAMRNGIKIDGIDLWLFGGVAKLSRDSKSAGEEFRIAAAGPLVTLLIAVAGFAALVSWSDGIDAISFDPRGERELIAVVGSLTYINLLLLVFNLLPAFPLDGGRIARAIAWKITGSRSTATRFAARVGRVAGWLMVGLGAFLVFATGSVFTGVWLAIIGMFIGQAAKAAEQQTDVSDRIDGLRVSDVMDDEPVAIPADLTLDRAEEEFFLRYRYPWFPVVGAGGRFVGLVTQDSVEALPEAVRAGRTVTSVMAVDGEAESRMRVNADEPLETLLGLEGLVRLGAIMAVDGEGRLRGIVTADQVRRALAPTA
jgi:Zn-dependent protease/CBS domain-containing protein